MRGFRLVDAALLAILTVAVPAQGPLAASQDLGGGCSPYTVAPQLAVSPPVIGGVAVAALGSAPPATYGELWASVGPPQLPPWIAGGLCPIFLDAASATGILAFVTGSAPFSVAFLVPADPALAGFELTLQVVLIGNIPPGVPWPLNYVTSNGVHVTFGY